jgi:hypothetical protein
MKLTDLERSMLMHQHMILAKAGGQEADSHELAAEILYRGYHEMYPDECLGHLDETVPKQVIEFVRDVFDMYRLLKREFDALPDDQKTELNAHKIRFGGFDGNHEGKYMRYAQFVREKLGRWSELDVEDYNSHDPCVDKYAEMLAALPDKPQRVKRLTSEQIRAIIEAPYKAAA